MSEAELGHIEQELAETRQRLAADLARLCSPATLSDLKDDILAEVQQSKDQIVRTATEAAKIGARRAFADLKTRAAANPVAALAIGIGLAWRLARRPPIATALVGAGLIGLMKTNPHFASTSSEFVAKVSELGGSAKDKVSQWSGDANDLASRCAASVADGGEEIRGRAAEATQATHQTCSVMANRVTDAAQRAGAHVAVERDSYLLAGAALAIAAALGISYARRAHQL